MQLDVFEIFRLIKFALERGNVEGALGLVNDVLEKNAPKEPAPDRAG